MDTHTDRERIDGSDSKNQMESGDGSYPKDEEENQRDGQKMVEDEKMRFHEQIRQTELQLQNVTKQEQHGDDDIQMNTTTMTSKGLDIVKSSTNQVRAHGT